MKTILTTAFAIGLMTLSACATTPGAPRTPAEDAKMVETGQKSPEVFKSKLHEILMAETALTPAQRDKLESILQTTFMEHLRLRGVIRESEVELLQIALAPGSKKGMKEIRTLRKKIRSTQDADARLTEKTIDDVLTTLGKDTRPSEATTKQMLNQIRNLREY